MMAQAVAMAATTTTPTRWTSPVAGARATAREIASSAADGAPGESWVYGSRPSHIGFVPQIVP